MLSIDFPSACVLLKLQHSDVLWRHVQSNALGLSDSYSADLYLRRML